MEGGGSLHHCPSCGSDTTRLTSERIVVDTCGHYKCRKCLLYEDHGCATCRVHSDLREVPERHSVIVSRKPSASNSFSNQPVPSPIAWTQEPAPNFRPEEAPVHDESSNTNPAIISTTQSSYSDGNNRQTKTESNDLVKDWICSVNFTTHREPVTENQDPDSEPCDIPDSDHDAIIQRGKEVSQKFLSEIQSALSINDGGKKKVRRKKSFRPEEYVHISKGLSMDGNVSYTCTICNRSFSNKFNIRYHIPCADESARYACTHCDRTFKSSSHLTYHVRSVHSGERPYKCEQCSKTFTQLVKLKRHSRLHTGERPFLCDICKKSFKTNYHLKEHRNIHNVDQHHGCAHCSKKFADKNNLRRHMKIFHMDGQDSGRFRCKIRNCMQRFLKGIELEEHKKNVHGLINKFSCDTCQQVFQTSKDLERHKTIHTDTKAFRCSFCDMSFRRKDNLQRHQKLLHKDKHVSSVDPQFSSCETKSELHTKAVPMDDIEEDGEKTYANLSTVTSGRFKSEFDFTTAQRDGIAKTFAAENSHDPLSMDTTKSSDGFDPLVDNDRLEMVNDRLEMSNGRMEMSPDTMDMNNDRLDITHIPNTISSSRLHQLINKINLPELESVIASLTEEEKQAFKQMIKEEDFQEENQALRLILKDEDFQKSDDDTDKNQRPHMVKKDFLNRYRKQSGIPAPVPNNAMKLEALQPTFQPERRTSATMSARASSFGRASQSISSLERERILQGPLDMPEIAMDDNQRLLMMNSLRTFVESLNEGNTSKAGENLVLENGKVVETNRASTVIRMTPHGLRKLTVFDDEEENN